MHQERREPPAGYGRPSEESVVAGGIDTTRDNNTQSKKQDSHCPRRKPASGPRTLGPGERSAISALRRPRHIQNLHGLGPRALGEFLIEIGVKHGITIDIERTVERYAALDPEAVRLTGGDHFPALPIHVVRP